MTKTLIAAEKQPARRRKNRLNASRRVGPQAAPGAPAQGSPEWLALLDALVIRQGPAVSLTIEQTSRESIYGDDLR